MLDPGSQIEYIAHTMLKTAIAHFNEDISRARALLSHAKAQPPSDLKSDILRAAWMMAVGACDAYFCDAYGDLVSRTLRAKHLQSSINIPEKLNGLKIPAIAILRQANDGWRWRMAARELIEDESVLSLEKIKKLFNVFFEDNRKIINVDTIENWIVHSNSKQRLFGISAKQYNHKGKANKRAAKKLALEHFQGHFEQIFQRRHDCIHNCDRPKVAKQKIRDASVDKTISDIDFLVQRCQDCFLGEFPAFLTRCKVSAKTKNRVCQ